MSTDADAALRVLVVAQQPFRLDDLTEPGAKLVYDGRLVRRPGFVADALEESAPDVALVDTAFPDGASFKVIGEIRARSPETRVIALTPDPPPHDQVAWQLIQARSIARVLLG